MALLWGPLVDEPIDVNCLSWHKVRGGAREESLSVIPCSLAINVKYRSGIQSVSPSILFYPQLLYLRCSCRQNTKC